MAAHKRIWAWPAFGPESVTGSWSANTYHDERTVAYILATEHERIVAEKDAEIARLHAAARDVVLAYLEANPMRTADMHPASCGCLRCEIDRLDYVAGS